MVSPLSMTVGPSSSASVASEITSTGKYERKTKWRSTINVLAFAANVVITYGIGTLGLFGFSTNAELSEKYQTLVTPIGFAFAIWGIIFLSQAAWVLLQLLPALRNDNELVNAVGYKYVGVCINQVVWTLLFSQEWILPSLFSMLAILVSLLGIIRAQREVMVTSVAWWEWALLQFPFAVHTGWILAASLLNVNVVLVYLDLGRQEQLYAAYGSLGIILVVSGVFLIYGQASNYVIALVLSWATFGMFMQLRDPLESITETFSADELSMVQYGAVGVSLSILICTCFTGCLFAIGNRGTTMADAAQQGYYVRATDRQVVASV